jgi:AcrR family transcriptional regulator
MVKSHLEANMRRIAQRDDIRDLILDAVDVLLSRYGYKKMTMDDVAREVGIGKGTIYRYFGSKEELYLAAIGEGLNGLHAAVTGVLQQDAPIETTIEAVVRTLINYFWHQRDFFVLMHRLEPKLKARERADWQKRRGEAMTMIRRVLERAAACGDISQCNTRIAVEVLFGMIRAACLYRAESDRPEDLTHQVTAIFLRGLAGNVRPQTERTGPLLIVQGGTPRQ